MVQNHLNNPGHSHKPNQSLPANPATPDSIKQIPYCSLFTQTTYNDQNTSAVDLQGPPGLLGAGISSAAFSADQMVPVRYSVTTKQADIQRYPFLTSVSTNASKDFDQFYDIQKTNQRNSIKAKIYIKFKLITTLLLICSHIPLINQQTTFFIFRTIFWFTI